MFYKLITNYISSQAIKIVENIDFVKKDISYSKDMKQNREIKKLNWNWEEELVRAFILTKLVNELWYKTKNIEIEKEYTVWRKWSWKVPRIDIIVRDEKWDAFLFIELKCREDYEKNKDETIEEQLFNLASQEKWQGKKVKYLVLYTFEEVENEIKDKCMIIDYEKYTSFESWKNERNFVDEIPARYERAVKKPFVKWVKDLDTVFTHEQLESLRKNLHNVLWWGGGTDDNEVFSSLVNIILAKIQDESEKEDWEKYDFQSFAYEKGQDEVFETNEDLFERINLLYRRALKERLNIRNENELKESFVIERKKFSLNKLKYAVSELEGYSFVEWKNSVSWKDILWDFFEAIISNWFKQSKWQFFTHINIVKTLLYWMQIDRLAIDKLNNDLNIPYIIDPSAWSGTFLIEYMKFITSNLKYRFKEKLSSKRNVKEKFEDCFLPDNRENKWAKDYIYWSDINFNLWTAVKVNMILHWDWSANIFVWSELWDGLLPFSKYVKEVWPNVLEISEPDDVYLWKQVNWKFDIIITNPPFSVDLDNDTKKNVAKEFIFWDKKNSENLFIERYYQLLRENWRLWVVLPESVFDTTENKYIRLFIYKYYKVKAIVSLPQLTFEPYTSTKTSLLLAQKKTKKEIEIWNEMWAKYSNEWGNLKTRVENLIDVYFNKKDRTKLSSIKDLNIEQEKEILSRMLKDYIEKDDKKLATIELIKKYTDELKELCKWLVWASDDSMKKMNNDYPANTWWVFGEVSRELNYEIFMAEVENIGYKRTKRWEKPMPNELYREDKWVIILDDGILETVVDYLREVKWD